MVRKIHEGNLSDGETLERLGRARESLFKASWSKVGQINHDSEFFTASQQVAPEAGQPIAAVLAGSGK